MATKPASQLERITALEVQVKVLQEAVEKHTEESKSRQEMMDKKLDELLGLKNKGLGAFWVASALVGTGILGTLATFFDWFRGFVHG